MKFCSKAVEFYSVILFFSFSFGCSVNAGSLTTRPPGNSYSVTLLILIGW